MILFRHKLGQLDLDCRNPAGVALVETRVDKWDWRTLSCKQLLECFVFYYLNRDLIPGMEKKMIVRRQHHNIAADIPTSSWQLIQLYSAPKQDTYRKWRENLALLGCNSCMPSLLFLPFSCGSSCLLRSIKRNKFLQLSVSEK